MKNCIIVSLKLKNLNTPIKYNKKSLFLWVRIEFNFSSKIILESINSTKLEEALQPTFVHEFESSFDLSEKN
jgi:hypothetical protein